MSLCNKPLASCFTCIIFQLKPVRSLDSLRPAWSGRLRHGPPPCIVPTECQVSQNETSKPESSLSVDQTPPDGTCDQIISQFPITVPRPVFQNPAPDVRKTLSTESSINFLVSNEPPLVSPHVSSLQRHYNAIHDSRCDRHPLHGLSTLINPTNPFIENMLDSFNVHDTADKENGTLEHKSIISEDSFKIDNQFARYNLIHANNSNTNNTISQVEDPFDTSQVHIPSLSSSSILIPDNPKQPRDTYPIAQLNTQLRSAQEKVNITKHYKFFSFFFIIIFSLVQWIHLE